MSFTRDEADRRRGLGDTEVADLIGRLLDNGARTDGDSYGVILLSGPDEPETIRLAEPIMNDTVAAGGRGWAWTLNQRYTRLERLVSGVTLTSEL